MKNLILFLLTLVSLTCCKEENSNPNVSDEQINQIGNKLAEWDNPNSKIISINDTYILWQGPNAGGCNEVYFEFRVPNRASYFDLEALENGMKEAGVEDRLIVGEVTFRQTFLNGENNVEKNLKSAISNSNCSLPELKKSNEKRIIYAMNEWRFIDQESLVGQTRGYVRDERLVHANPHSS